VRQSADADLARAQGSAGAVAWGAEHAALRDAADEGADARRAQSARGAGPAPALRSAQRPPSGRRGEACPVSTEGGTRRVQSVREGGGRGGGEAARRSDPGAARAERGAEAVGGRAWAGAGQAGAAPGAVCFGGGAGQPAEVAAALREMVAKGALRRASQITVEVPSARPSVQGEGRGVSD
jgi:hypothetical protein